MKRKAATKPGAGVEGWLRLWAGWLLAGWLGFWAPATSAQALQVDPRDAQPLWPAVWVLVDETGLVQLGDLLDGGAMRPRFERPQGVPGNLGRRDAVIWLRVPLQVTASETLERVLDIDYPSLNRIDLYHVQAGRVVGHQRMGNALRVSERPLAARTHAAPLALAPGTHELFLRVQTTSSLVLPMTLHTPETFWIRDARTQLVQGLILGLALCMAIYSAMHWLHLRDPVFLQYTLLIGGNMVFLLNFFGIGPLVLWPDLPGWSVRAGPIGLMVAVVAGIAFIRNVLAVAAVSPLLDRLLAGIGVTVLVSLAATFADVMSYPAGQTLVTVLGLVATGFVVPVAYLRARQGDRVAVLMLVGWLFYLVGAFTVAGLVRGFVEPTLWSQLLYPLSMLAEMTAWMAVLGLRVQTIHRGADRARVEAEAQRSLAHTDALTGLPNRRGLQLHLQQALAVGRADQVTAVYLLDLDGFKPVNDRWGHDVGDALLVAVGQRLAAQLRSCDIVARLGGDEFVVMAQALPDEAAAQRLGAKLLATVDEPFEVAGQRCEVGMTIGYALAPLDGHHADELLKRADSGMYAGKQAGRRRVQRGVPSLATVSH